MLNFLNLLECPKIWMVFSLFLQIFYEFFLFQETGYLCDPSAKAFGMKMSKFLQENTLRHRLGENGNKRVKNNFSFDAFTNNLDTTVSIIFSPNWSVFLFPLFRNILYQSLLLDYRLVCFCRSYSVTFFIRTILSKLFYKHFSYCLCNLLLSPQNLKILL